MLMGRIHAPIPTEGRLEIDIARRRGDFALDVALSLPLEGITGLVGPSGAGKSTLFACLAGLARPDRGRIALGREVFFDARRGIDLAPRARRLGVVFQDGLLFPHLSVRANLTYGARRPDPKLYDRLVATLGLGALLARRPPTLSGGERSRVAIGRALMSEPRLLLLDEPLAALDAHRREEAMALLVEARRATGVPMLYVSHAAGEIRRLADRVVSLREGRVAAPALGPAATPPPTNEAASWA
jgi:molybdate transport system ATP-binding protein